MRKNTDSNSVIVFDCVSKTYDGHDRALIDASFSVPRGAFACIVGPSGEGKSTILRIIAGLESPTKGTVVRPEKVSMVFQSGALMPWLTVQENIALPLSVSGMDSAKAARIAKRYALFLGLKGALGKVPRDLSGGERERVGIARALAANAPVILLDEPFSALDPRLTDELHKDLLATWRETGTTIVMVSHSIEEAVSLATHIFLVKEYSVLKEYRIDLPYPRREHAAGFMRETAQIRRAFFKR